MTRLLSSAGAEIGRFFARPWYDRGSSSGRFFARLNEAGTRVLVYARCLPLLAWPQLGKNPDRSAASRGLLLVGPPHRVNQGHDQGLPGVRL